jgi:ribosomal protein S18 acetylase RimI-like enzyme
MWLETYDFNDKAIHLYEELGFVREGLQRDIYRDERGWLSELLYGVLEDEYAALAK